MARDRHGNKLVDLPANLEETPAAASVAANGQTPAVTTETALQDLHAAQGILIRGILDRPAAVKPARKRPTSNFVQDLARIDRELTDIMNNRGIDAVLRILASLTEEYTQQKKASSLPVGEQG